LNKMPNPGLFKDLNKRTSDLLTKEFPSEKSENKVEWKGETSNNVSLETSLLQKADGSILGTFTPKYKYKPWGTTLSAELKTSRDFKAEAVVDEQILPGLKTTVTGESKGEDLFSTFAVEYKHELATVTASADYGQAAGSTLKATTVVGSQGFSVGGSAEYFFGATTDSLLKELHTVLGYSTDEFDIAAFGKLQNEKDANILGATYFHKVNSDLSVGTEVSFDTANTEAKPKLVFGTQYRLEADTVLKGKFDTTGKLGLSYQQKFSKNSKLTISSTIDTNNIGAKNSSTLGFTLSLS